MNIFDITDFGAVGDGQTDNTAAIQKAVDACGAKGGGRVSVPAGDFLSGPLLLAANLNLYLEPGARLIADKKQTGARKDGDFIEEGVGFFIGAIGAPNISITGYGEINGRGDEFMEADDGVSEYPLMPEKYRMQTCYFRGCDNLRIENITIARSSHWTVHLVGCNRVFITGVSILNTIRGANNDGIDPDSCHDVFISRCHIEGGDDAVVIKTTQGASRRYGNCENIIISDCTLISRGSAVKIGTETHADIRDCVISNCIIRNSNRGIGLWVRDGGTVENVLAENIIMETRMFRGDAAGKKVWWGKGEPIFMSVAPRIPGNFPGKIRNITFRAITAECENSICLLGSAESPIENVTFDGVRTRMRLISGMEGGLFDEQPPAQKVYAHENPAFFARFVSGAELTRLKVEWGEKKSKHWSNVLCFEHSDGVKIDHVSGRPAGDGIPAVTFDGKAVSPEDACLHVE